MAAANGVECLGQCSLFVSAGSGEGRRREGKAQAELLAEAVEAG